MAKIKFVPKDHFSCVFEQISKFLIPNFSEAVQKSIFQILILTFYYSYFTFAHKPISIPETIHF